MIVELGNRGLENSWQAPFPGDVKCVHCGETAMPAVSIMEEDHGICDLRKEWESDSSNNLWPHDATAFAIYLCPKCLEPTALFSQG